MTTQPTAVRAINAVGGVVGRFGVRPSLDDQSLLDAASKSTGLTDFGDGGGNGRATSHDDGERIAALDASIP